jgi:hypothetical protein
MNRRDALAAIAILPTMLVATTNATAERTAEPESLTPPKPHSQWEDWNDVCHSMANMEAASIRGNHPLTGHLQSYATAIQFADQVMLLVMVRDPVTVERWSRQNSVSHTCDILGKHASDDGAATCIAVWANMSAGLRADFQGDSARRERSYRRCEIAAAKASRRIAMELRRDCRPGHCVGVPESTWARLRDDHKAMVNAHYLRVGGFMAVGGVALPV